MDAVIGLIIPIAILQFTLLGVGLYDLTRPDRRVRGDNKLIWALVVIFVGLFGPLIYFMIGRED